MESFEDKVVVVTGGAHGIGATVVSEFEKEGAKVAYIDHFIFKRFHERKYTLKHTEAHAPS